MPILTANASIRNLTLTSGGTLSLGGNTLTITGTLTGTGYFKGSATSGLTFTGSSTPTLYFNAAANDSLLGTLTLSGSGGATLGSNLGITQLLAVTGGGTFTYTGQRLTLKSSAISTAVVSKITGTITGTTATVERYIPMGYRSYRDLASGVYNTGNTIFNSWQENGRLPSSTGYQGGYGIFITGPSAINTSSAAYVAGQPNADGISGQLAANGSGLDYSINGIASAFTYTNGVWSSGVTNTKTTLDPFQGYRVLVRGDRGFNLATTGIVQYPAGLRMVDATALRATGSLITGNVTYTTTGVSSTFGTDNSVVLNSAANGFSMLANPYVAPVWWGDGTASSGTNTSTVYGASGGASSNLNASFWYLDPTHGATGKYWAYNALSGSSSTVTGATLSYTYTPVYTNSAGYIQPGQAFFVETGASGSPTVKFTEATKGSITNLYSVFGTTTPLSKIYVSLETQVKGAYSQVDGAAVAFASGFGNTAYGPQDAHKVFDANDNLYISDKGTTLSIDGRLPATASDAVALNMGNPSTTAYQLKVDATNYVNDGYAPLLYDSYRNTTTAISGIDSVAFTIDTAVKASYENRFTILFAPSALAVNSIVASASLSNDIATIVWNTVGEKGESYYEVQKSTDAISFSSIAQQTAKNTATASYSATDNSVSTGNTYYRIKAVSQVGTVGYSNVAKLTTDHSPLTTIYPNPLTGKTLNVSMGNLAVGKYVISIYNVLGEKVNEQTISHGGGSASHAITIDNMLAAGVYEVAIREAASNQVVYQGKLSVQP
jgi:hypothetical protein